MANYWVLPWLFNAQAASIDWDAERRRRNYQGPVLQTQEPPGAVQVRWLLHPALGLPRQPFVVSWLPFADPDVSDQDLADGPGWEELEIVGLPIDETWDLTGYDPGKQGLVGQLQGPTDAALRRLRAGAPRLGWDVGPSGGSALPHWEPSNLQEYLQDLRDGPLLSGLRSMLEIEPNAATHAAFSRTITDGGTGGLQPRMIHATASTVGATQRPAQTTWRPLGLMALSAGSDALASLALGFGTAVTPLEWDRDSAVRISTRHELTIAGQGLSFELAAIARLKQQPRPPVAPRQLWAARSTRNRPHDVDGPFGESVHVNWQRPLHPHFSQQPATTPYPVGYAIGAVGPGARGPAILLTRRPPLVQGWLPYVTGAVDASQATPAPENRFVDHVILERSDGGVLAPDVQPDPCTYCVAAQDLFGRWSPWATTSYTPAAEEPQQPAVLAVQLTDDNQVVVDFGWDWSDRSPQFVELRGAYADDRSSPMLSLRCTFRGASEPFISTPAGASVEPLDADRTNVVNWGPEQDRPGEGPAWRFYRLTSDFQMTFNGRRNRTLEVRARGQRHLHWEVSAGLNISAYGRAARVTRHNPAPPSFVLPVTPEIPQWASLPDTAGVSRAVLRWSGDPGVAGYAIYAATETALLAALGKPGPDTAVSLVERLATLRRENLQHLRAAFRRVNTDLVSPGSSASHEVALPRGSAVLHLYAITAFSHNQVESDWPTDARQFIAVATPRLAIPAPPTIEATAELNANPPRVKLQLLPGAGPTPSRVQVFRTRNAALAGDADAMGPPLTTVAPLTTAPVFDSVALAGWDRLTYRAVAWTEDDPLRGLVGGRSIASAAATAVLPPPQAPEISNLRVNLPGSTPALSLISWECSVPTTRTTFGPHVTALETFASNGGDAVLQLRGDVDRLRSIPDPTHVPIQAGGDHAIVRFDGNGAPRFFAWAARPSPGETFRVVVTMTDPLGRVSRSQSNVPLPLPAPQLGAVSITPQQAPQVPFPPRYSVSWSIPVTIPDDVLSHYTLTIKVRMMLDAGNIVLSKPLDQVPTVLEPTAALFSQLTRVAGTSLYFIYLRRQPQPISVTVTLMDATGRSAQRVATIN